MYDAFIFLAEGFEEIEAITTIDILRRGGVFMKSVSLTDKREVTGDHRITVLADMTFDEWLMEFSTGRVLDLLEMSFASKRSDLPPPDITIPMMILPGGPGRVNIEKHRALIDILKRHHDKDHPIAAICGAPIILGDLGMLENKTAVCYPAFENSLNAAKIGTSDTVTDGNITTSKAAGTTVSFALEILRIIQGAKTVKEVCKDGLFDVTDN